jgi:hypothetical protein
MNIRIYPIPFNRYGRRFFMINSKVTNGQRDVEGDGC